MAYSEELKKQQAWLYDNHFFAPGISRAAAVDGYSGNKTSAAMQKAQEAGWSYTNGEWTKPQEQKPRLISRLFHREEKPSTYTAWTPRGTEGSIEGKRTAKRFNESTKEWEAADDCAAWANAALREYRDSAGQKVYDGNHVFGNAWTRLTKGRGTKMVYSGYDGMDYNPEDAQWAQAKIDNDAWLEAEKVKPHSGIVTDAMREVFKASDARNAAAADNVKNNLQIDSLDKNKTYLVNMYYKNSPQRATAWFGADSGTTGTHTGNLYWDANRNTWRVAHNIHRTVYDEDLSKVLGSGKSWGITAVSEVSRRDNDRPGLLGGIRRLGYDIGIWENGGKLIPRNTKN